MRRERYSAACTRRQTPLRSRKRLREKSGKLRLNYATAILQSQASAAGRAKNGQMAGLNGMGSTASRPCPSIPL